MAAVGGQDKGECSMADKANDIRQEIIRGRQEITDARAAITEKLTTLENRVQGTIDGVKHTFDLRYQFKQRPWFMFGGSVLLGYMAGRQAAVTKKPSESTSSCPPHHSIGGEIRNQFNADLAAIKGAALGALVSTLWSIAKRVLLPREEQRKQ